ncbi:MAG: DUF2735 domain-containing protein [Bradyrhizobium sp.]|uniref:DUF2735 domain-containing protein n=1 Tax=Bradyrhizobium sp. TaxID=376 RepID=UPI0025C0C1F2|nr:DUF2735 domain-containing protein [Bradyrhizobium sp.]MBI5262856.1 DUF2735 domain-containing protein [Bradyrhizobium sp.]
MANKTLDRGSAKIYQFPVGGRADARRQGESLLPADQGPSLANEALCSSSWYHQAAIQEDKPKWEH